MSDQYQTFINDSWANHDKKSEEVANNLRENLHLIDTDDKVAGFVSLIVHTLGGHLGKWNEGRELLQKIESLESYKGHQSLYRGLATLSYCMQDQASLDKYIEKANEKGSKARIYAMAASELTGQGKVTEATKAFETALASAPENMSSDDATARSLAISGNNLACELEEKEDRSQAEVELMLIAAKAARKYWEISGGWIEVERAEYRLAMSNLKAGDLTQALEHARLCESICKENNADFFESFFAHEALTKVNRAICEELKSKVKADYQSYCVIP